MLFVNTKNLALKNKIYLDAVNFLRFPREKMKKCSKKNFNENNPKCFITKNEN